MSMATLRPTMATVRTIPDTMNFIALAPGDFASPRFRGTCGGRLAAFDNLAVLLQPVDLVGKGKDSRVVSHYDRRFLLPASRAVATTP